MESSTSIAQLFSGSLLLSVRLQRGGLLQRHRRQPDLRQRPEFHVPQLSCRVLLQPVAAAAPDPRVGDLVGKWERRNRRRREWGTVVPALAGGGGAGFVLVLLLSLVLPHTVVPPDARRRIRAAAGRIFHPGHFHCERGARKLFISFFGIVASFHSPLISNPDIPPSLEKRPF